MNHIASWLRICNQNKQFEIPVSNITVKNNYHSVVMEKAVIPPFLLTFCTGYRNLLKQFGKNYHSHKLLDNEGKYLWFKIKHRILPTKSLLREMKITTNNICPLCYSEPETIEHIFIYCTKNQEAWIYAESLLNMYWNNNQYYIQMTVLEY